MWGTIYYIILLPIFQNVTCTASMCVNGKIEDSLQALSQWGDHPILIFQSLGIVCSIAMFNATGVATTKYASAPQRSTVDTSRTVIIWAVSVLTNQEVAHW